ncbi:MAG TPA: ORF6N domain-containing protein [Blastocatellia bacterium]|nr:ORF6N domain-containing protein [Blastocatellia bacterium]
MNRDSAAASVERIEELIYVIRGQRVMLDSDLARIYGVPTKVLNQAVKRNGQRFPEDFMFRLSAEELEEIGSQISRIGNRSNAVTGSSKTARLRSQIVTSMNRSQSVTGSQKHRDPFITQLPIPAA